MTCHFERSEKIKALLIEGTSLEKIRKMFNLKRQEINTLIFEVWGEAEKVVFDDKIYSTSEEYLLNGDQTTYKDLSPEEKTIYKNLS